MAKRSRRARRQEKPTPPPAAAPVEVASPPGTQKAVNFVQQYAHIYKELRNVFIIAVVMFGVLFGLAYVI